MITSHRLATLKMNCIKFSDLFVLVTAVGYKSKLIYDHFDATSLIKDQKLAHEVNADIFLPTAEA